MQLALARPMAGAEARCTTQRIPAVPEPVIASKAPEAYVFEIKWATPVDRGHSRQRVG